MRIPSCATDHARGREIAPQMSTRTPEPESRAARVGTGSLGKLISRRDISRRPCTSTRKARLAKSNTVETDSFQTGIANLVIMLFICISNESCQNGRPFQNGRNVLQIKE